jgi:hypothetical protein
MTSELTVRQGALPTSFQEIQGLANAFVQSGMFQDTKQLAQAIVKIQAGAELSLPPVYSMQNINLIRNRLTTSANTLALLIKRSGRYNYRIKEHDEQKCIITFYESDGGKWVEVGVSQFTIEDAKRADLLKPDSGWLKYPRAMLFSRAISQGARIYCPDAIGGIYTDEEIRSIPPRPEDETPLTPAETVVVDHPPEQPQKEAEVQQVIAQLYDEKPPESGTFVLGTEPNSKPCLVHPGLFLLRQISKKTGQPFYSHRDGDKWCYGGK